MDIKEFIELFKATLELDPDEEITLDTELKTIPEYDSVGIMAIIAMVDEKFGKTISFNDFQSFTTVKSLKDFIEKSLT
jgi:acyl carrier protein